MPSAPETRYARSGDVNIAYQVAGEGPFDLVYVPGWISNIELMWEEPAHARLLRRLASFSRLILFDKPGTGMSDPVPLDRLPTLEQRMDAVRAVMDAAGSERAALFGSSEGGLMSVLFAATYPERTSALVTLAIYAKRLWSADYPWAPTPEARAAEIEEIEAAWGGEMDISSLAPSADEAFKRRAVAYLRRSASPGAAVALMRMNSQIDVRAVLPTIRVPTLVLQRVDDRDVDVEGGTLDRAADPGREVRGASRRRALIWAGDVDAVVDEVEEFLTGRGPCTTRTVCSPPCCSRTSPVRRSARPSSATVAGAKCSTSTMPVCAASSTSSAVGRSTRPATASSPRSTVPPVRSAPPARSGTASASWVSTSGQGSTPASAS